MVFLFYNVINIDNWDRQHKTRIAGSKSRIAIMDARRFPWQLPHMTTRENVPAEPMSSDRQGIQVIARAASILRALENEPDGLSLNELAGRLALARSTIQRIVSALSNEQLLITAGARAGVKLGPALIRLASAANIETDKIARPIMQELSRSTGETVDLSVLQGRTAMFIDQVVGSLRLVAISSAGEAFPLHCTANGKALLACLGVDRRRELLSTKLHRLTDATVVDPVVLERQIEAFYETQLSWDLEEHSEGICAVGTAFKDPLGRNFALSVPLPVMRFAKRRDELAERLLEARESIMKALPGSFSPRPAVAAERKAAI